MQNNLHISKKSSTFVADLGIVPTATIKYYRVMKKECVFKCQIDGKWYKVYKVPHQYFTREYQYVTYCGRRRLEGFQWSCIGSAVGAILDMIKPEWLNDIRVVWK